MLKKKKEREIRGQPAAFVFSLDFLDTIWTRCKTITDVRIRELAPSLPFGHFQQQKKYKKGSSNWLN